jgi:hypothetical protein
VPAGNYTAVNLGVAIAKAMNAALTIGDRFESTYDASTNRMTLKLKDVIKAFDALSNLH